MNALFVPVDALVSALAALHKFPTCFPLVCAIIALALVVSLTLAVSLAIQEPIFHSSQQSFQVQTSQLMAFICNHSGASRITSFKEVGNICKQGGKTPIGNVTPRSQIASGAAERFLQQTLFYLS